MRPRLLFLLGMRCAGKSLVGRAIAQALERGFIDLDDRTARLLKRSSAGAALRDCGEAAFRDAERRALEGLAADHAFDGIVALGGGTPIAPGCREIIDAMRKTGECSTVYLYAPAYILRARFSAPGQSDRPALTPAGAIAEIETLLAQREPVYRAMADMVIDTTSMTIEQVAAVLIERER